MIIYLYLYKYMMEHLTKFFIFLQWCLIKEEEQHPDWENNVSVITENIQCILL